VPDVPFGGEPPDPDPFFPSSEPRGSVPEPGAESAAATGAPSVGAGADAPSVGAGADAAGADGAPPVAAETRRRRYRPSRRQRWVRRVFVLSGVIVLLAVALGLGGYFYLSYQFHRIKIVTVHHLKKVDKPGAPFTVLLVGSDSRAFASTPGQCAAFGCGSSQGGQRSDVIVLVRVVPAARKIQMMSIPRDTWVSIPGHVQYVSGQNRINAAFNNGPSLLVQTIGQDFHIPINYFVEVNFVGLQNMVDAIGGIHLDFRYPLQDAMSGLRVPVTGCQIVHGGRALALVRSRHMQYEINGAWYDDGGSDFTRIRNQQSFFRAVIHQLNAEITNPFALNGFITAATHNLTIDQTLTEGTLLKLAREFHNFPPGSLKAETLPTVGPYITSGGAEVLLPAPGPDEAIIKRFLAFGTSPSTVTSTSTTQGTSGKATTTTTSRVGNHTTVTTLAPTPSGETPIFNNQPEPWDPTPC